MKTGHISDLHHNPERHSKIMRILDQVEEMAPDLDLFTNSGENFHNPYNFTETSGFNSLLDKWERITSRLPVVTIRGTQGQHERPGMVETLKMVGVKILEPGKAYGYHNVLGIREVAEGQKPEMLLFGVPHPHKANILSADDKRLGREEANAKVNIEMAKLYQYYGALRAENPDIPALAVGHGVVKGKNTRDLKAMSSSEIYSTEAELKSMGCDFYAWGHYHVPTDFDLIRGGYLGSFAWSFNETNYKPAITVIDWDTMKVERIPLDINERCVLLMKDGDVLPDLHGCDVWIKNFGTDFTEADAKAMGAGFVKVTTEVEKEHKVRSEEVLTAETYQDKFKAVYPDATDRQLKVCEEFWEADKAEGKIPQKKTIRPLWCEIHGSKLFMERMGKETVKIDYRDLTDGLNMLIGPGGHGKSSILDYTSPFSVMFAQPNSLLSTFELGDSYVKQGWEINGKEYRITKYFKPMLKNPKAEYYAFEGESDTPVMGLESGNRGPFDEWCVSMFGSPRKYSTSVYNTQFDDNPATFQGQKINPSLFQANNIELKSLFHELAGTDLKHLELKCKAKADEFKSLSEEEEIKKSGVEESIPSKSKYEYDIETANMDLVSEKGKSSEIESKIQDIAFKIEEIKRLEKENLETEAILKTLRSQKSESEQSKEKLESDLSEIGNIDIEEINRKLTEKESEKIEYEKRLSKLPEIQKRNKELKNEYSKTLEDWNAENLKISEHNAEVRRITEEVEGWKTKKIAAERRKADKIRKAEEDTKSKNDQAKTDYQRELASLTVRKNGIMDQINTGTEMISNIKSCPQCGFIDPEDIKKREDYKDRLKLRGSELEEITKKISELKEPEPVTIHADTAEEYKEISEAEEGMKKEIQTVKTAAPRPNEPEYEDETIPTFDMEEYNSLKGKASSFSEDRVKEIRSKINEVVKTISSLTEQIESKKLHTIDRTAEEYLKRLESEAKTVEESIKEIQSDIKVYESKIADIDKQRESLKEYDGRIEKYREEFEFWKDMKEKWGPKGIPARILEHTGPYVDQKANEVLKAFYPIYKMHSETTKTGSNGEELEVFTINVINQETGREKPINSISGEERNFVSMAMDYAFRTINEQNSLEFWDMILMDEPDAHVSESQLQGFWNMVEYCTDGKHAVCVSHSPEIKYRSTNTIDIRSL